MQIKDRIKELRRVPAKDIQPNPKNWRTHPKHQQDALKGILAEVGVADALIARELDDGTLMLIDGHLRAETMPEQELPVLVLDVNEEEADKLLLALDPLAALAGTDNDALSSLIENTSTENDGLSDLFDNLAAEAGIEGDHREGLTDPDSIPEAPDDPVTQPGDLWLLGAFW